MLPPTPLKTNGSAGIFAVSVTLKQRNNVRPKSEALSMTAATVYLSTTSRVSTMCAAIVITRGRRTFTRFVSACFGRLGVVHFLLLICDPTLLLRGIIGRAAGNHVIRMSFDADRDAPSLSIMILVRWVIANDVTLT